MPLRDHLARLFHIAEPESEALAGAAQLLPRVVHVIILSLDGAGGRVRHRVRLLTGDYIVGAVLCSRKFKKLVPKTEQNQASERKEQADLRIIVGVTGASGAIYGLRLLERLHGIAGSEIHLVVSRAGEKTLYLETGKRNADLKSLAHFTWPQEDISAPIASGSFQTHAMIIAPCSIHTMSSIAGGISSNLMVRAADVVLKERRRLILMVRESPLHLGHLRTMTALAEMGAIIAPPVPGFYNHPSTIGELVDSSIDRVLDLIGLDDGRSRRWNGPGGRPTSAGGL